MATAIEDLDAEAEKHGGYGKPINSFFGGKSLHEMSHGESFFTLLMKRFIGNGLYLFDTLSNGDYVVVLPSSNFSTGAPVTIKPSYLLSLISLKVL